MANINITQIRMKRGNTAAASTYTGPLGELLVDTGLQTVRVQDGTTPGGMTTLATNVQIQTLSTAISNINANAGGNYSNANVASYLPTTSIITGINANVTAANLAISVLQSNATTQETNINSINANVTAANVQITDLWSNAATQANSIIGANAAIVTSNTAMKSYVDAVTTAWTANAATQATSINSINANLGAYQTYGNVVFSTAATQGTSINLINANVAAANSAITTLQTQVYTNSNVATYLLSSFIGIGVLTTSGNLTVGGNLIVNGNTTVINTASYTVEDNIIQMADGNPADSLDLGFVAHRTVNSTLQHTGLVRDSSAGNWKLFSNVTAQPGATVDFTSAVYDDLVVGNISANIAKNGYTWRFGTNGTTQFPGSQILAPAGESITMQSDQYSQLMWENANVTVAPNMAINSNFYVAQNNATLDIGYRDGSSTQLIKSWYWNVDGGMSFPDTTTQYTAFSNAAVATYLANYDGGINFTASPAVITGLGNISSANFTFANGVNILSTVAGGAADDELRANIGSFYTYANATFTGGGTYSNANVVAMLAANTRVFIGNVGNVATYSLQANNTQVFIGGNTAIASGNAATTNSTFLMHNMYFAANGTASVRNTGAGVGILSFDPSGFSVSGLTSVQTANATPALTQWIKSNTAGTFFSGPVSSSGLITAAGAVAVNNSTGIQTNQTTFPLVNQTATTILFGGAATTINLGSSTIGGSGSNVFVGNAIGTSSGNLTVRAFGTYNSVNSLNSAGGYATTTYSNIAVTGGSGTGMLISMSGAASGYLASATVTNPGTGYRNGETITIPAGNPVGSLGGSFVIGNYNAAYLGQVLANYTFGMDGNLILPGNLTIAGVGSIRYANGVNYASTITGTYSNTNVASYLTTATITTTGNITAGNLTSTDTFTVANITTTGAYGNITGANVISANTVSATNYLFANGVNILSTVSAGGSYANADVAAYLAANTALYLGNPVTRYPNQANVTQMFVGNTTTIGAGSNQLGGTYILNNAYFGANGAMYARNTQTGAAQYRVSGGTFDWAGTTGAVTANSVQSFALWGQLNSSGLVTYNGIGITSAGTLTVQGASGLVTSQTTGALFNTTATTINLGGAATAINMGTSATNPVVTLGSSGTGTLVLGNATATGSFTASGNVTAASVTTLGSGGNISGVGNIVGITSNTTITAGAYVTSFLSNGAVINNTGSVVATVITTIPTTVGALPAAATSGAGARAFVTDANSTTFGAAAVGGSTNKVPVYSDGSAWYIG